MSEWKIYHNPRCSKSRQTLSLLQEKGISPTIIEYLKETPSQNDLKQIIDSLDSPPSSLVRTKEEEYKSLKFNLESVEQIVENLSTHPKLMERPVVVHNNKAVIGRPPESIEKLF